MKTEEFNKKMVILTEEFINNWTHLVDIYAEENELGPNHKLCVFLFSHLGIVRALANRVWKVGNNYMEAVVALGEEMKADA